MPQAESQQYRPHYGLSTIDQPEGVAESGAVPAAQLHNSQFVGWRPLVDVADYKKADPNPERTRCFALLVKHGAALDGLSPELAAVQACDGFWLLQRVLNGRLPQVGALRVGAEALGSGFRSALGDAVRFGPNRYDGTADVRRGAFDDGCSCFRYTSGSVSIP